jgi:sugar phosphate permease
MQLKSPWKSSLVDSWGLGRESQALREVELLFALLNIYISIMQSCVSMFVLQILCVTFQTTQKPNTYRVIGNLLISILSSAISSIDFTHNDMSVLITYTLGRYYLPRW